LIVPYFVVAQWAIARFSPIIHDHGWAADFVAAGENLHQLGMSPSTVSATSVDTAWLRPSGAGISFDMSPM
jgi:hypothetical protein